MSTAKKAPAKKAPAKKAALKPAPTYKRLKGQRVFITGAGSGIGRATALRFAAEGAQLALADLRGAKETAAEIKKAGGTATAYDLDVTKAIAGWFMNSFSISAGYALKPPTMNMSLSRSVIVTYP